MMQALLDACVDFCEGSMALRYRLDTATQAPGFGEVELDLPPQQDIVRVLAVWVNGVKLAPTPTEHAPLSNASGAPYTYSTRRNDSALQLVLHPTPADPCQVTVEVALKPQYSATSVEDDMFNQHLQAVIASAKARLMAIPDQPFTNLPLSGAHAQTAQQRTSRARVEASYGSARGGFRAQMRPFN